MDAREYFLWAFNLHFRFHSVSVVQSILFSCYLVIVLEIITSSSIVFVYFVLVIVFFTKTTVLRYHRQSRYSIVGRSWLANLPASIIHDGLHRCNGVSDLGRNEYRIQCILGSWHDKLRIKAEHLMPVTVVHFGTLRR